MFKNYNLYRGSFIGSRVQNNDITDVDTINKKYYCSVMVMVVIIYLLYQKIIEKFNDNYDFEDKKNIDKLYLEIDNYFYKNYC